jgi:two-component system, NtrC family, sensor kinase
MHEKSVSVALQVSPEHCRLLLDSAAEGIYSIDLDGECTFANSACLRILGYNSLDEVQGRNMHALSHHTRADGAPYPSSDCPMLQSSRRGQQVHGDDEVLYRKDGSSLRVEYWAYPIRAGGRIAGAVVTFLDITERRKAEKALRESEEQFREFVESTHEVFWMASAPSGEVLYVSRAYEEVWGRRCEDLYREPSSWRDAVYFEDRQTVLHLRRRPLQGELVDEEYRIVRPDGTVRWVRDRSFPIRDKAGNIKRVAGIAKDVTEWKEAGQALRRSEEHFRLLFRVIPHPVWVSDSETLSFLEVNDAAVSLYGYSRAEFLEMIVADIEAQRPGAQESFKDLLRSSSTAEHRQHRTKSGHMIEVEIHWHTLEFGGRKAALVVAQDITERKRLELDLRHAQKLEAVGGLAAGIAHELNTPIQFVGDNVRFLQDGFAGLQRLLSKHNDLYEAAVSGPVLQGLIDGVREAEKAEEAGYLKEEIPKALTQSLEGVNRVATIVRAMKDFAHRDQGEKTAADLNKALASTLIVARNEIKYVADVETEFGQLPLVVCNIGDMNQVFLNLLVNAAHAIGDAVKGSGRRGMIRVKTWREQDHALIAISDTGCGIPEEIRDRIFDPFFTTKEVGRGTGQGLAISHSIVAERHGGNLSFESCVGRGTTFYVSLPLTTAVDEAATDSSHDKNTLC